MGTSVKASDKLTVSAGIAYTIWSSYDELAIDFDPALVRADGTTVPRSATQMDWDDVFRYQIGAEYALTDVWALRTGYVFDSTPDPDNRVDCTSPSNDRHIFSLGVGYAKNNFSCDLGYTYLFMEDRDVAARPAEGIFGGEFTDLHAHTFGIAFGYKLQTSSPFTLTPRASRPGVFCCPKWVEIPVANILVLYRCYVSHGLYAD